MAQSEGGGSKPRGTRVGERGDTRQGEGGEPVTGARWEGAGGRGRR